MFKRLLLKIEGIVQGVGFRPFVYRQASLLGLKGWVSNNSAGVYIDVEGESSNLYEFIDKLKYDKPFLCRIENIAIEEKTAVNYRSFKIKRSEDKYNKTTLISPDIGICEKCIEDITNPSSKRYKYPFASCTNCGPRFSILKAIPYDRKNTTMNKFKLCSACDKEYNDYNNRRFYAETNSCKICGPHIWIENHNGVKIEVDDELNWTRKKLKEGKIFAIKGLGGFQLVCDAENEEAIKKLRQKKNRQHKPFAVMVKDIETAKKYCSVNYKEEKLLKSKVKPIVILNRSNYNKIPKVIAPYQKTLGVMLPYTPLHYLLFSDDIEVLIMTSANAHGLPLEYKNESAIDKLGNIADYFLQHNRDINVPIDDSIVRVVNGQECVIRRARGYTPNPIKSDNVREILACGSNMKNTFCIAKNNFMFLSQYNGDLENVETIDRYINNIRHFEKIFKFTPGYIACDMHPNYLSIIYDNYSKLPKIEVQHHHAHIVSCLTENKVKGKVIGIAYDGTGYGTDKKVWGGEFFICDTKKFIRLAHLKYVKMPGAEMAIRENWRMAVAYIYSVFESGKYNEKHLLKTIMKLYGEKAIKLIDIIKANINCPETSSMGRLFDAAASLIGVRDNITYEGQAASELEAVIELKCKQYYEYDIRFKDDNYIIEGDKVIKGIIQDKISGVTMGEMSSKFHNTVVEFSKDVCKLLRKKTAINQVALSGGVFQNSYLLKNLVDSLKKEAFIVYTNKEIPTNDGGIALGQIIVANEILNNREGIK
ncbi:hydrogenase maturation protein HypF [Clostridium acetobutylicum]|uniref:Carbamoyltransferase n=1 Tax=Clostridium acetobutylicum (strain ATCC 824 / DSM 792 / JCM 1419 / IAM 19013 / LMG 5710 / NBRC 13948 / NRRL B-527 / VKM B-1787 / 2291 / W) TaxID=272562 RepID=Q97KV6_CLOAB|nr:MULTISPECIES: carbamoyltransferase HypF [Clostridium]AAK78786.1 Hydrogenase maturation factor (hypF) [Clostridium acetobutylicum ATCC 824]ADZ19860.1 Hydrogenase maturation factor (hypF) [Clostridium acetobutylicum EA 2018]AEI33900.1 hydrogenase maturation factor (hypF) [Clostridium acetobutylicum DSM 1731]AWV80504.1 carbamoyltransferase HypF [Clostridium acetobutylicum]MBC2392695.1 carbamoyltransferase HypF [Clostridium acetobutylicum]